jgi:hypothetical protein
LIALFTIFPATELEGAQRPQQKITKGNPITNSRDNEKESKMENDLENGPRPVSDAQMDAWQLRKPNRMWILHFVSPVTGKRRDIKEALRRSSTTSLRRILIKRKYFMVLRALLR